MKETPRRKLKKETQEKVEIDRNEAIISDLLTRVDELTTNLNNLTTTFNELSVQLDRVKDRLGLE